MAAMRSSVGGDSSHRLSLLFLAVLLPPAIALIWLGLQLLEQDRAFLAQREAARREAAADGIARALRRTLVDAERWLMDDDMPDGAARVTISSDSAAVGVHPAGRTHWVPRGPALREPPAAPW